MGRKLGGREGSERRNQVSLHEQDDLDEEQKHGLVRSVRILVVAEVGSEESLHIRGEEMHREEGKGEREGGR